MDALVEVWHEIQDAVQERRKLHDGVNMAHLAADKRVIGCTTSGAAKYR